MFGRTSRGYLRFGATVHQVLLSELHQKVSIQLDVEVEIGCCCLRLLDVEVQRGVKEANSFDLVTL